MLFRSTLKIVESMENSTDGVPLSYEKKSTGPVRAFNTLGSPKLGAINMYHLVVHDTNAFISPGNLEQNYDFPEYVFPMILLQSPAKKSAHPIFFRSPLKPSNQELSI